MKFTPVLLKTQLLAYRITEKYCNSFMYRNSGITSLWALGIFCQKRKKEKKGKCKLLTSRKFKTYLIKAKKYEFHVRTFMSYLTKQAHFLMFTFLIFKSGIFNRIIWHRTNISLFFYKGHFLCSYIYTYCDAFRFQFFNK